MRGQVGELDLLKETLPPPRAHPAGVTGGRKQRNKASDPSDGDTTRFGARKKNGANIWENRQGRSVCITTNESLRIYERFLETGSAYTMKVDMSLIYSTHQKRDNVTRFLTSIFICEIVPQRFISR